MLTLNISLHLKGDKVLTLWLFSILDCWLGTSGNITQTRDNPQTNTEM